MIAVVGGYGVGMTMRLERAPEAGETVSGGAFSSGPGGKGSNQAIGIARLGQPSALFTAIGSDAAATQAHELWRVEGVQAHSVVSLPAPTMTGFILVDAQGENRIAIAPGALGDLLPAHVEGFRAEIRAADLLVVSLEIPWPVALRALQIAREEGTRTLLNPAPARALLASEWSLVDLVTPNSTELATLLGRPTGDDSDPEALARELSELGTCAVVVTLGGDGAVVADRASSSRIAAVRPPAVVDTTGAGDAFTAALAVALVEGLALVDAARWACFAGAHAVSVCEVIPALPTRAQLSRESSSNERQSA